MLKSLVDGFASAEGFMPHGMCYLWRPDVLALHVGSDAMISIAYMTISLTLVHFVRKRTDLQFTWIFRCFAFFIVACGTTHLMEIWTIWYPTYWISGAIKAVTAVASASTAILLLTLIPLALRLPSPSALRSANVDLEREIGERLRAEEDLRRANATLEGRVKELTEPLAALNQTLVQENDRLAMAADAAGLAFWNFDIAADDLRWDERMYRLHGVSPIAGVPPWSSWVESLHPDDRVRCKQQMEDLIHRGRLQDTEYRVTHTDGTVRHLRAVSRVARDADGRPTRGFGVIFDVTERKRADDQFRLAVEAAPTGMLMVDTAGKIVHVNSKVEKLFGYRHDELVGQFVEVLVPERFRGHHPAFRKGFFGNPVIRAMGDGRELHGLRRDGSEMPIEIGLNPLTTAEGDFVLSSIVDITERKRATEQFRLALEAAPVGMLLMNATGSIVLVNAQIENLFGYARAELLGQKIEILVPERFRALHPEFREGFRRAPRTRAMGAGSVLFGLRKDGTEVPVEISLNPLQTMDGDFVLGSVTDLSQRQEIDRLRTDFISTVSHELRTPLTSISGSLGLLQADAMGVLPKEAAAMVRIAYQNCGRLVRIINDILDFGKLDAGKLAFQIADISLTDLIHQSIEAHSAYAEKYQVRFLLDVGSADDRVMTDPNRLMQVVANLLSNAAKFSPPGADVRIRVLSDVATMRIEVEDAGPGIPLEFRGRIFEKFAQADASPARRFEGTGLGLSIARKIVEAMGGTIGFSSLVGRGSIFHVVVPRTQTTSADTASVKLS